MRERMKPKPGFVCVVPVLPKCDFCNRPGRYDFRTVMGPWAHGCDAHWVLHRATPQLGVGNGQMWITPDEVWEGVKT